MLEAIYKVQGMSCQGCERSVENAVRRVAGVESAKANAAAGTLEIKSEAGSPTSDAIRDAVERCGFVFQGAIPAKD